MYVLERRVVVTIHDWESGHSGVKEGAARVLAGWMHDCVVGSLGIFSYKRKL
jgi:hypothetical protein